MKLNNEKAIREEIAKLDKEIVTLYQVTNASRGHAIKYREGYRDALVKVLTDMPVEPFDGAGNVKKNLFKPLPASPTPSKVSSQPSKKLSVKSKL